MPDWDEWFAYSTSRTVKIRDKRLGLLKYFFQLIIFVYIVVFALILQGGYLAQEVPVGTARLSIQNGIVGDNPPYCDGKCMYLDDGSLSYPNGEINSIFITTAIKPSVQTVPSGCASFDSIQCLNWTSNPQKPETYFVSGTENASLGVFHSALGVKSAVHANNFEFPGQLLKYSPFVRAPTHSCETPDSRPIIPQPDTKLVRKLPSNDNGSPDIIYVSELLDAAGIDLEAPMCFFGNTPVDKQSTKRAKGLILLLDIHYDNEIGARQFQKHHNISYTYTVIELPITWKVEQYIYGSDITSRTLWDRHGIKIAVLISGNFYYFNISTALVTLTTSLGLLAISSIVVNSLALYVLPERIHYHDLMVKTSPEFSHLHDAEHSQHHLGILESKYSIDDSLISSDIGTDSFGSIQ